MRTRKTGNKAKNTNITQQYKKTIFTKAKKKYRYEYTSSVRVRVRPVYGSVYT